MGAGRQNEIAGFGCAGIIIMIGFGMLGLWGIHEIAVWVLS